MLAVGKEVPNTEYTYDISQLAFGQMSERHVLSVHFLRLAFIFRGTRGKANLRPERINVKPRGCVCTSVAYYVTSILMELLHSIF